MDRTNEFLATERVGTLMRKYSVPCIVSLLVGALYNIVDQIFIANASYLGSYGNAANTVVFPLTVVALAIAVMIGDGACSRISMLLGLGNREQAARVFGNGVTLALIAGLALFAVYLIFPDTLLTLLGGRVNDETFRLSKEYFFWITLGIPFYMFGQAMNPVIRADGSPRFAMVSTLAGAITNIVLDPLFIFAFRWGMKGAAIATVLGQMLTAGLAAGYLLHLKSVTLVRSGFRPDRKTCAPIASLGLPSFLAQISLVFSMTAVNNMIWRYGAEDPVFGQAEYAQVPMAVVGIFGASNESVYYTEFAVKAFRIYLCMVPLACVNKATFIFLQAMGKAFPSTMLSMVREIVFGVGITLLLPPLLGLDGVLYSMPVSDVLTSILSAIVILRTYRNLTQITAASEKDMTDDNPDNRSELKGKTHPERRLAGRSRYTGVVRRAFRSGNGFTGKIHPAVRFAPRRQERLAKADLTGILGRNAGKTLPVACVRNEVVREIEVTGVVHMAVEVDVAEGDRKRRGIRKRNRPRRRRKRDLVTCLHAVDPDPGRLGEDDPPRFRVEERPDRAYPDKRFSRRRIEREKTREENMHRLSRP